MKLCTAIISVLSMQCLLTVVSAQETYVINITSYDTYEVNDESVNLYALDLLQNGELYWTQFLRIDGDWVKLYGSQIVDEEPVFWPEPYTLVKAENLEVGDNWIGLWDQFVVHEEAVQETTVTVNAGTFETWETSMSDTGGVEFTGNRYFAENVGMIRTYASYNSVMEQSLESYSIVGGYGYFPLAVGNNWMYTIDQYHLTVSAPWTTINIDGEPNDWAGIDPVLQDPQDDDPSPYTGCDIRDVYIAVDSDYIYLMCDFWDGDPNAVWGQESSYAYQFHIRMIDDNEDQSIGVGYDGSQWFLSGNGINVGNSLVACGSVVEVAIPKADVDDPIEIFRYQLQIGMGDDDYDISGRVRVIDLLDSVSEGWPLTLSACVQLHRNYPNPFNPSTTISYSITNPADVQLAVYNISGQVLATLVDGWQRAGQHDVLFDGAELPSGIYFYTLQAGGVREVKRMVMLK